jgi:tRNA1(Val) A37 N6-methylase TrmN6
MKPNTAASKRDLPATKEAREQLHEKGQVWTPTWLAEVLAGWVTAEQPDLVFDPAVGAGTFFAAARTLGFHGAFEGYEIDPAALEKGKALGLGPVELSGVTLADFLASAITKRYAAMISNPPFIRHHRLSPQRKRELREMATQILGAPLDGRVGLHVYFLLKCLSLLQPQGRLAFILPADVCEGTASAVVWEHVCRQYRIDAVLTFSDAAAPFPQLDINAMVFLISRNPPQERFLWCRVNTTDRAAILNVLRDAPCGAGVSSAVTVHRRRLEAARRTGFSRPPRHRSESAHALSERATVVRGIATGANRFFFLTKAQMQEYGLQADFFCRAIGRTRDCEGARLLPDQLDALEQTGRPTWLLNLTMERQECLPQSLRSYLQRGEAAGLPLRPLLKGRRPWYKMEKRAPPPILFAYLGRRACRFILNEAGVVPLTGFLCVYPRDTSPGGIQRLWRALNHPQTIENLRYVAKSYGRGALKVEPRGLERLEIPRAAWDHALIELPIAGTKYPGHEPQAEAA